MVKVSQRVALGAMRRGHILDIFSKLNRWDMRWERRGRLHHDSLEHPGKLLKTDWLMHSDPTAHVLCCSPWTKQGIDITVIPGPTLTRILQLLQPSRRTVSRPRGLAAALRTSGKVLLNAGHNRPFLDQSLSTSSWVLASPGKVLKVLAELNPIQLQLQTSKGGTRVNVFLRVPFRAFSKRFQSLSFISCQSSSPKAVVPYWGWGWG